MSNITYRFQTSITDKELNDRIQALIAQGVKKVEIIKKGVEALERRKKR